MCAWQRNKSLSNGRATPSIALKKLERYCAYQDRCHQEVRRKLYDLGLYGEDVDQVMAKLIEDKFLDEERFARSYARGKHKIKHWGRYRIERELKQRQISRYCIKVALSELDELPYFETLRTLLQKRLAKQEAGLHAYVSRQDLIQYGMRKGYATSEVLDVAKALVE